MRAFVRNTGHSKTDDERAWDLLRWAVQIKRGFDVDAETAMVEAPKAADQNSIAFMNDIAKRIDAIPSVEPQNSQGDAPASDLAELPDEREELETGTRSEDVTSKDFKRKAPDVNVRKAMGLTSEDDWPHGEGVWVISSTSRRTMQTEHRWFDVRVL